MSCGERFRVESHCLDSVILRFQRPPSQASSSPFPGQDPEDFPSQRLQVTSLYCPGPTFQYRKPRGAHTWIALPTRRGHCPHAAGTAPLLCSSVEPSLTEPPPSTTRHHCDYCLRNSWLREDGSGVILQQLEAYTWRRNRFGNLGLFWDW